MGSVRQNPVQRLLGLFICVCIALCTNVAHNIAQNIADNFPLTLQTITIAPMMSISRKGDGSKASCVTWEVQIFHWEGAILVDRGAHCKV